MYIRSRFPNRVSQGNGAQQRNVRKDWKASKAAQKQEKAESKKASKPKGSGKDKSSGKGASKPKGSGKDKSSGKGGKGKNEFGGKRPSGAAKDVSGQVLRAAQAAMAFLRDQAAEQPNLQLKARAPAYTYHKS